MIDDLDEHELAMLNQGPELAITAAAASLRSNLIAHPGRGPRTFTASGQLRPDATELERELFGAVRGARGNSAGELVRELGDGEAVRRIIARLTDAGLLQDRRAGWRVMALSSCLRRGRPRRTARGRSVLAHARDERADLRLAPHRAELALAVALFGGGMLWVADHGFAAVWGASAAPGAWWSGGDYGGAADAGSGTGGCGGCGGCG